MCPPHPHPETRPRLYDSPTTPLYGLISLPASLPLTPPSTTSPAPLCLPFPPLPSTPLATRIHRYAKSHLPAPTYLHSLRVYTYGLAIAHECFPGWNVVEGGKLEETWFCCAMLHDIGTVDGVLESTRLSYEFWAGIRALRLLRGDGNFGDGDGDGDDKDNSEKREGKERVTEAIASLNQAESIAEAIFRHQNVQDSGNITLLTRLIHLGTLLDNVGANAELVHPETVRNVNAIYTRKGWRGCFGETVEREKWHKPYAMVGRVEGFEGMIVGNQWTATEEG